MEKTPGPASLAAPVRWLLLALAGVCIVLGVVGLFLPVLPTVPFLLVAAWASARCSPRLHHWLHTHPRFGRLLCEWHEAGLVPRRAKWLATLALAANAGWMVALLAQRWPVPVAAAVLLMAAFLAWLWRRPERRAP